MSAEILGRIRQGRGESRWGHGTVWMRKVRNGGWRLYRWKFDIGNRRVGFSSVGAETRHIDSFFSISKGIFTAKILSWQSPNFKSLKPHTSRYVVSCCSQSSASFYYLQTVASVYYRLTLQRELESQDTISMKITHKKRGWMLKNGNTETAAYPLNGSDEFVIPTLESESHNELAT
jgi:hypothetical protein